MAWTFKYLFIQAKYFHIITFIKLPGLILAESSQADLSYFDRLVAFKFT
jgi:hypothetical protein